MKHLPIEAGEEPLLNEDGTLHQSMIRIGGKQFRCQCGCNVFHRPDKTKPDLYQCNCCPSRFETEPATTKESGNNE